MFSLATMPRSSLMKVTLWDGTSKTTASSSQLSFGHIALTIKGEKGKKDIYVSLWADGSCRCERAVRKGKAHFHSIKDDQISLTKIGKSYHFLLDKLDTLKMVLKFERYKIASEAGKLRYRLKPGWRLLGGSGMSCATLILDLLEEGGIRELVPKKMVEDRVKFISSVVYHMGYTLHGYSTVFAAAAIDFKGKFSTSDWLFTFGCSLLFSSIKAPSNIYTPSQINDLIIKAIKADCRVSERDYVPLLRNSRRLPFFSWPKRVKETIYSLAPNLIGTSACAAGITALFKSKFLKNNVVFGNLVFLTLCVSIDATSIAQFVHDYPFSKKIELIIPLILPLFIWEPLRLFNDNRMVVSAYLLCIGACRLLEAGRTLFEVLEYFVEGGRTLFEFLEPFHDFYSAQKISKAEAIHFAI